jgi:ATPase subunit of ABC transporter with duplicated ATPase domains
LIKPCDAAAAKKKAAADAAAKKKAAADAAAAKKKAAAEAAAKKRAAARAAERAREKAAANRSEHRAALRRAAAAPAPAPAPKPAPAPVVTYPDNLDGWIRESMAVMAKHNIPGSYNGIYRNIIRESSGNPNAINLWDINAQNGIPSKGLLQVINPTFQTYHVDGTSWNIYDPVANITAACNYAYHVYGSMDNVYSAY